MVTTPKDNMAKVKNLTPRSIRPTTAFEEFSMMGAYAERPLAQSMGGLQMYSNEFRGGYGDSVLVFSPEKGLHLGAANFEDAPFRVNMAGSIFAPSLTAGVLTKTDTSQALTGSINVGAGNVVVDGVNKRILINDGTNNRVLMGFQSGGF